MGGQMVGSGGTHCAAPRRAPCSTPLSAVLLPFLVLAVTLGVAASAASQAQPRFGLEIPMRDGVRLSADAWFPEGTGQHPTIVVRIPYLKTMGLMKSPTRGTYFARHGYVWLIQDVRGRGDSEGQFDFFFADAEDGYDTIEWVASQPWSNGRVCMMGVSYLATVQWLAARERPPHLNCIVPTAAAGRWFDELPYIGGAFQMQFILSWINGTSGSIGQGPNASHIDLDAVYRHRPLLTMDEAFGRRMPLWRDLLSHPTLDAYWKRIFFEPDDFAKIDLPVLHITGWFDWDQPGALYYWDGMRKRSPARDRQHLLAGPWTHPQTFVGGQLTLGDMRFSGDAVVDYTPLHLAFFERYLKGATAAFEFPRARIYVTGSNQWRDLTDYPPPGREITRLYLRSGGRANSLAGDGRLTWAPPAADPPDRFTYDPRRPVPSEIGGQHLAIDHRQIERRDDVLVYTSEVLDEPLDVIGRIFVELHAATDARDTDFTAKILDVLPDGRALKLGSQAAGVIRARYRHGRERTELLTPGQAERYRIELHDVAHTFLAGHRIRVEISSSAYPFINPNQNTGNPVATDTEWKVAEQTVYHDRARASALELPVVPRTVVP